MRKEFYALKSEGKRCPITGKCSSAPPALPGDVDFTNKICYNIKRPIHNHITTLLSIAVLSIRSKIFLI